MLAVISSLAPIQILLAQRGEETVSLFCAGVYGGEGIITK